MAKDIGHILGMIFMPSTPGDLVACFLDQGIIDNKKEDGVGFNSQNPKELVQGGLDHLFHGPEVLSQEAGEAGKRAV